MEWKLDFSKSVTLVYYYVKLVGLAPFVLKNNRFYLPNLLSKIYPVILAFGYSILFSVIMVSNSKVTNDDLTENRKLWNIIKHAVNCVVVFLIVIVCTCMRKRIIHFMNELCFISNELDRIGIEENRSKILKIFITMSAVANVIYLITSFIPPIQIDIYWFESVIKDGIRVCVVSIFVQILHCVKKRFRFINEKLYREVETHYEASSLNSRNLVTANNPRYNHRAQSKKLAIILRIRKLETLHLKLCGVVKQMIHVFAVSIFLYYIESTFILVISCNWACYIYSAIDEPNIMEKLLFMVKNHSRVILIISTIITEMLFMANAYSTTCQQVTFTTNRFFVFSFDTQITDFANLFEEFNTFK